MAMRKAKASKIGGKFLCYGETGSGKSWFQLTFPDVAVIDSETGVAMYEGEDLTLNNGKTYNNLVLVDNTSDLDDLEADLDAFLDGEYDNVVKTLGIDSETKFYGTMQVCATEVEERKARAKGGAVDDAVVSQRQWGRIKIINMKLQQAKIDLSARGIHVVSIAQATDERDKTGEKVIGIKPDMHKSVKFDYDTVLEFFAKEEKDGVHYYAKVLKDRTNVTKRGDIIENPCYDIWKPYFDKKNGLETNQTSYRKDIDNSTESMVDDASKTEKLVEAFKEEMAKIAKEPSKAKLVKEKANELKVDLKALDLESSDKVAKLVAFVKSLV